MVYVPILKIDLPEPRLQELLPGAVNGLTSAATLVFDAVHDYLKPLSPAGEDVLYQQVITHLPREFRKARKRIIELDIHDDDKISEELEDAQFAYYRRRMREDVAGYSDEETEDVTFRRLMTPESATRQLFATLLPGQQLLARQPDPLQDVQQQAAAAAAEAAAAAAAAREDAALAVPSRSRRAAATAATGGAGLALGMGAVKLVRLIASRLQRGKKKQRKPRRPGGGGSGQSSRRASESGAGTPAAGSRRAGRTTPRAQQR